MPPEALESATMAAAEYISSILSDPRTPVEWRVVSTLGWPVERRMVSQLIQARGAALDVIAPFSLSHYLRTLHDRPAADEIERLLELSEHLFQPAAPGRFAREPTAGELFLPPDPDPDRRRAQYARATRRAIDSAEIVLAVWDGNSSELEEEVRYALEQDRVVLLVDPGSPDQPPRQARFAPSARSGGRGEVAAVKALPVVPAPAPRTARALSPGYHQLAAYNRDLPKEVARREAGARRRFEERFRAAADTPVGSTRQPALPPATRDAVLTGIAPHFIRADLLAVHYQRLHERVSRRLYYLAALAVTVVTGQALFFPTWPQLILFEVAILVGVILYLRHSRLEAWHPKWLNDRHLAERLRQAMFASVLGPAARPGSTEESPFFFYQGPQTWLADTARQLREETTAKVPREVDAAGAREFLLTAWIRDQVRYYGGKARSCHRQEHRYHAIGMGLFGVTVFVALLHCMGAGHPHGEGPHSPWNVGNGLTFLAVALPAWGSTLQAIKNQLEFRRIAARSERMERVMRTLAERFEEAATLPELRDAVAAAEEALGTENHEWWILLGFRDPALPA